MFENRGGCANALPSGGKATFGGRSLSDALIIFEDEHLLVVNKSPGLATAAGKGGEAKGETALGFWQNQPRFAGVPLINAHRLDAGVGGVLVLAKTKTALDFASGEFQGRVARRVFEGFVVVAREGEELERVTLLPPARAADGGLPDEFVVEYGLGPDLHVPGRMHVYRKRGGRPARTQVRVLERFAGGRWAWIEAEPETSRDQQVQAHLAAVGAPVVGDNAHGLPEVRLLLSLFKRGYKGRLDERPMVEGLALHLARVTLRHPETREPMTFEAPRPKAFEVALRNLRKFAR